MHDIMSLINWPILIAGLLVLGLVETVWSVAKRKHGADNNALRRRVRELERLGDLQEQSHQKNIAGARRYIAGVEEKLQEAHEAYARVRGADIEELRAAVNVLWGSLHPAPKDVVPAREEQPAIEAPVKVVCEVLDVEAAAGDIIDGVIEDTQTWQIIDDAMLDEAGRPKTGGRARGREKQNA